MRNRANENDDFMIVEADTLDNLVAQAGIAASGVNWIKVDVEGAEIEILKGAHSILSNSKNISLLVEVHGLENYVQTKEILESYRFRKEFETSNTEGDWRHVLFKKEN